MDFESNLYFIWRKDQRLGLGFLDPHYLHEIALPQCNP